MQKVLRIQKKGCDLFYLPRTVSFTYVKVFSWFTKLGRDQPIKRTGSRDRIQVFWQKQVVFGLTNMFLWWNNYWRLLKKPLYSTLQYCSRKISPDFNRFLWTAKHIRGPHKNVYASRKGFYKVSKLYRSSNNGPIGINSSTNGALGSKRRAAKVIWQRNLINFSHMFSS